MHLRNAAEASFDAWFRHWVTKNVAAPGTTDSVKPRGAWQKL
jgi:hypothetical protein